MPTFPLACTDSAHPAAAGERVLGGQHHVGDVVGDAVRAEVVGDRDGQVAPAMDHAQVRLPGGHQLDGVPRLALGEGEGEVGVGGAQVACGLATDRAGAAHEQNGSR